jgi:hypothetical protein
LKIQSNPKGILNLSGSAIFQAPDTTTSKAHSFVVRAKRGISEEQWSDREYIFCCKSEGERMQWMKALRKASISYKTVNPPKKSVSSPSIPIPSKEEEEEPKWVFKGSSSPQSLNDDAVSNLGPQNS